MPSITEKSWKIPPSLVKEPNRNRLVDMLTAMNQINDGRSYYIRDSYEQKIIVDSATSAILCGYTKEIAEKEGFAFYHRIFNEKEWKWFDKMFKDSYRIFHKYPIAKRKFLVSQYNFEVRTVSQGAMVLHHKSTPYQLCDNGNLWLSLSSVTVSTAKSTGDATITNTETGEQYIFHKDKYVLSDEVAITHEELLFLELMCNDLSAKQIIAQLNISESGFHAKKQRLFDKLKVKNAAGAVYKAGLMGII